MEDFISDTKNEQIEIQVIRSGLNLMNTIVSTDPMCCGLAGKRFLRATFAPCSN